MEPKPRDPDDFLEASLLLDESHHEQGFEEGYKDGLELGKEEGREIGLKLGFKTGEELSFYHGCVDIWSSLTQVDPAALSMRIKKRVEQLRELVESYPILEPEDEHVQEMMDSIRLKFRITCANMRFGHGLTYDGYPQSNRDDVENN